MFIKHLIILRIPIQHILHDLRQQLQKKHVGSFWWKDSATLHRFKTKKLLVRHCTGWSKNPCQQCHHFLVTKIINQFYKMFVHSTPTQSGTNWLFCSTHLLAMVALLCEMHKLLPILFLHVCMQLFVFLLKLVLKWLITSHAKSQKSFSRLSTIPELNLSNDLPQGMLSYKSAFSAERITVLFMSMLCDFCSSIPYWHGNINALVMSEKWMFNQN